MNTESVTKNQESESLKEQIVKLQKQLESFKHSNDHFLKNKLFLHYDIKEPEKVVVDCETKLPVLTEVEKKQIQKGKETDPTHLIIEGDNYHALSVLNYTHAGKIDLIYIDPPYNTGNKDFIYNDHFVDREDSFRHSKWLSFMAHRLRLAENLLTETGVIFISIDDNEQAHLRLLCDQIFGEENIDVMIWNKEADGKSGTLKQTLRFRTIHEYVIVCYKNKSETIFNKINEKLEGRENDFQTANLAVNRGNEKIDHKNYYEIINPSGDKFLRQWKWDRQTVNRLIEEDLIFWGTDGHKQPRLIIPTDERRETYLLSILNYGGTTIGGKDLKEILPDSEFSYPKPIILLEKLFTSATNKCATILDFFAGSGTTGHAVLKLNAQDGGTRQFILCSTNDEKEPIVDKVTYPRIKKVIDGYSDTAGIPANLRYFKTDFVENKGSVSQLKIDLTRQCAEMLCVKENVFEAVKLKKQAKNYKFFKNGNKYLGIFFDFFTDPEFKDFIAELNKLPQESEKAVYIFVLDGSASIFADEFASVANCEIKEIPQKILDIYKRLAREVARK